MILGVTELLEYKRCRRRWHLGSANGENLERIVPSSPSLPLGTVIHEALKAWIANPKDDLVQFYNLAAIKHNKEIIDRYKKQIGVVPNLEELQGMHDALMLGESMMSNYQAFHGAPLPEGFELVAPEQEVQVPIPGTDHFLRGRMDAIVFDTKRKLLFVMDHKSYGNRPRQSTLDTNEQFICYDWMLHQLKMGEVGGITYDGMWKRAAPPRGLQVSDLFLRIRIEHPPVMLQECEWMLAGLANEIAANPVITTHRPWDGSCDWGCQFNELCLAMSRGNDTAYIRRRSYGTKQPYETGVYEL